MKRAELLRLGSLPSYRYGEETYDSAMLGLGALMVQRNGAGNEDKWAGPVEHKVARYFETTAIQGGFPWVMQAKNTVSEKLDYVFYVGMDSAAVTRRVYLWTYNRLTAGWGYVGLITLTFPTATNHTIRAFRMDYEAYSTGTVAASGTAVTGTGTSWVTNRIPVGCRIGFGSTDPAQIVSWYAITAIASDGSLTLGSTAGTVTAGSAYVIEDLRAIVATTNATATNGGLYVTKGLSIDAFTSGGTTIPAATTVDNIRAVYWLKDATTNGNTVSSGMALEPPAGRLTQYAWVGNGATTQQMYKHNIRAALTLTAGASTSQFVFATGISATLTGTVSQLNNGRYAVAGHGTGAGQACYYFVTTTRIYRSKPLSTITASDPAVVSGGDLQVPVWPGNNATFSANTGPGNMSAIEYSSSLDMFLVSNVTTTPVARLFMTKYRADGSPIDRAFSADTASNMQATADGGMYPIGNGAPTGGVWIEGGMMYGLNGTAISMGYLLAAPVGADWEYAEANDSRILFPKMTLTDCDRTLSVFAQEAQVVGSTSGYNLAGATEPHRIYYRTTGIDDDSGTWTLLDQSGTFSVGVTTVQLMAEFRAMGHTAAHCSRIMSLGVVYDDTNTDSRYQFSATESSAAAKQFAWRHAVAFGGAVPHLRVRLHDAVTDSLLVDDDTSTPTGTWERSTDGTTYVAWTSADKSNNTTYVRYTPASIADDVQVRASLTLL